MVSLVGILNITPDSFSDGGNYMNTDAALQAIEQMISNGADIIDIGAESTRPGATALTHAQEWQRLAPILENASGFPVPISLDTRHPQTVKKALNIGVSWINDVSGFTNHEMIAIVKNSDCKLVMMHSLGVPADKNITVPPSDDIIKTLLDFARRQLKTMEEAGIKSYRIIFDPGIGFGKTPAQSKEIIERIDELESCGLPLFIGHSRKSFFEFSASATLDERDMATLHVSKQLADAGVDYLRVHNIKLHRENL